MSKSDLKQWVFDSLSLFFGIFIFYLLWMGAHPLLTPDEARYTEVSREMLASHGFSIPLLNGIPFFDKPVLFYWLQMVSMNSFGVGEWAARLPNVILGVLGCLFIYNLGRVFYDRETGMLAALVLATSFLYFLMSHYANLDLSVAFFITGSFSFFMMGMKEPQGKKATCLLLMAYAFAGLAVLTKGLIGFVFPTFIIGAWILFTNQWFLLKRMHLFWGILLVIGMNVPWLWYVQKQHHEFFYYYFYLQQWNRFISADFNDKEPVWFYIPVILGGLFPWSLFLIQSVKHLVSSARKKLQPYRMEIFLLLWPFLIFLFFSIPTSKTLGYIVPVFPPCALIIAIYLRTLWKEGKQPRKMFRILSGLSFLGLVALGFFKNHVPSELQGMANMTLGFLGFWGLALWMVSSQPIFRGVMVLVTGCVFFMVLFMSQMKFFNPTFIPDLLPTLQSYESKTIHSQKPVVVDYHRFDMDLSFYLGHPVVVVVADWEHSKEKKDSWRGFFAYERPYENSPDLWTEADFWKAWHQGKPLLVVLNENSLPFFKTNPQTPLFILKRSRGKLLVTNQPLHQ